MKNLFTWSVWTSHWIAASRNPASEQGTGLSSGLMILKCWSTRPCWSLDAALASLSFWAAESSESIEVKLANFAHFSYSGYKLIVSWVLKKQIPIIYPVICLQMPMQWYAIVTNPSCWGSQFLTKRDWISIARLEFMLLVLTCHKDFSNAATSYDCLKWKGPKKSAWYLQWDQFSFWGSGSSLISITLTSVCIPSSFTASFCHFVNDPKL